MFPSPAASRSDRPAAFTVTVIEKEKTPQRWLADFEKLPLKPELEEIILWENARKLFGL